jgi:hypothetical protein
VHDNTPTKKLVAARRIATPSRRRVFSAFSRLISAWSTEVTPSRVPSSISACSTHRRTDSCPTPIWRATAADAAVNDGYSDRCSRTSRTARSRRAGSIFLARHTSLQLKRMRQKTWGASVRLHGHHGRRHAGRRVPHHPARKGRAQVASTVSLRSTSHLSFPVPHQSAGIPPAP